MVDQNACQANEEAQERDGFPLIRIAHVLRYVAGEGLEEAELERIADELARGELETCPLCCEIRCDDDCPIYDFRAFRYFQPPPDRATRIIAVRGPS